MDLIESLFYMLWRGIAIGVLISAPMGPVGILCIQRTLDKGRRTGLYTGVGAAISDLIYCLLTGFGLSFIEDFVERNQNVIQLIGSAVLIGFGIYLFKKNPTKTLRKPNTPESCDPKKNILGGFLFTFSNPLILFLIIGLFARFNFLVPGIRFYHYIVGFVGIVAGALGWWWFVTYVVDKVRSRFSMHTMLLINRVIGVIILIFAVVGIVTGVSNIASARAAEASPPPPVQTLHWNKGRGYEPFNYATPDGILLTNVADKPLIDSVPVSFLPAQVSFRVDNRHAHPSRRYSFTDSEGKSRTRKNPPWALFLSGAGSLWITVSRTETKDDRLGSLDGTTVSVTANGKTLVEKTLEERALPFAGETLWNLSLDGGVLRITAGATEPVEVLSVGVPVGAFGGGAFGAFGSASGCFGSAFGSSGSASGSFGFAVSAGGEVLVSDITLKTPSGASTLYSSDNMVFNSSIVDGKFPDFDDDDPLTGYWEIFDRTLDESLLRLGGEYRLAIVRNGDVYDIIYIGGAKTASRRWQPGMLKGRLTPTSFDGIYNVEWIDAEGNVLSNSITAQYAYNGTLTIQFPYHASTVRLKLVEG